MQRYGREIWYRTDYILGIDGRLFQDVAVQYQQHHSDHYMVLGCLRGGAAKELTDYLRKACHFPLQTLCCNIVSELDKLFSELNTQITKPPLHEEARQA